MPGGKCATLMAFCVKGKFITALPDALNSLSCEPAAAFCTFSSIAQALTKTLGVVPSPDGLMAMVFETVWLPSHRFAVGGSIAFERFGADFRP